MIKYLFLLLFFFKTDNSTKCVDALVEKAFNPNFKADYFLFFPVETNKGQGRLMILKENFKKYMIALDSSYTNNDNLKKYAKDILSNKQKLYFHEFFYKDKFGQPEYSVLYTKNKFNLVTKKDKNSFLKKYLLNYNQNENYFNFNNTVPVNDFSFAYEQLFRMNFLVADSDGIIGVFKVSCD